MDEIIVRLHTVEDNFEPIDRGQTCHHHNPSVAALVRAKYVQ